MNDTSIIDWNVSAEKLKAANEKLIEETRARCKTITESSNRNEETLTNLNEMERLFGNGSCFFSLAMNVLPDKSLRSVCKDACAALDKLSIEIKMNKQMFDVMEETKKEMNEKLDVDSKRYLEHSILEGRLDGLHLDEATRDKVKALKEKISDLQVEFINNVNEENSKLSFPKDQLKGMSEKFLEGLPKDEKTGEYELSMAYPVYFPLMKECSVAETRRKMSICYGKRCVKENTPLFEKILELRAELAKLLGYSNYSEYCLATGHCAKSPSEVNSFLTKLKTKMQVLQAKEMSTLLEYKQKECKERDIECDNKIQPSDLKYYINLRENKEFQVDQAKLQEYFPLQVVTDGIFKIYQTLLGLTFVEEKEYSSYHEELKLYKVVDTESQDHVGFFYTDLHPRDGKYGHAAVFTVRQGCAKSEQRPVCAMVCNFTKPTSNSPSLLTHDEVETFFHEFGHVMHSLCTKAKYYKFGGTSVETDFVEAPSQMLENWCWNKESLKLMSAHYKDGSAIEEKLLDDLIRSKHSSDGCFNMRQILFANMDQHFHTHDKSDSEKIYREMVKEHMQYELEEPGMNMNASFQHLVGGYEAQYYSYLWSEVYSADMFETRFEKEGILSPKTGMDYRRCILEPGGSMDAKDMVTNFLGREPTEEAFLRSKGGV